MTEKTSGPAKDLNSNNICDMARNQLNKLMTGLAGEYLVAGMMNLKGWVASLTLKNFPGVDIFGKDPKTDQNISVQVKTSRENSFNIGINRPQRKDLDELIKGPFVFVHIDKNNDVTYYILTRKEVIDLINMTDDDYFVRKKDKSKEDYPMALWRKDLAPFNGHWESLWK